MWGDRKGTGVMVRGAQMGTESCDSEKCGRAVCPVILGVSSWNFLGLDSPEPASPRGLAAGRGRAPGNHVARKAPRGQCPEVGLAANPQRTSLIS